MKIKVLLFGKNKIKKRTIALTESRIVSINCDWLKQFKKISIEVV